MAETLLALQLLPLQITLRAQTLIQLPRYKGSALRGGFGAVFKETVCIIEHRDCGRCLWRARCAYPYVFDTPALQHHQLSEGRNCWKYCSDEEAIKTLLVLCDTSWHRYSLEVLP